MLLLAFDTATPAVTVALHDGAHVLARESAIDARRHGELLALFIHRVLASAGAGRTDLTHLAVGTGPGPYTGLRAGLVTARVLGSALGIPVDGLCTLDVIAADAAIPAAGRAFSVGTDARRKELYWASYSAYGDRVSGPEVRAGADLPGGLLIAGEGALLYPGAGSEPIEPRYPDAGRLAVLSAQRAAAGIPPAPADPRYLRRPDAREPAQYKRVTP